jgi:uncharacterized damage-inducible protein DinB
MNVTDAWIEAEGPTLAAFVDAQRAGMAALCDGLTEEQARRRLVPSRTTLLGILKHAIRVEKVWSVEAVTGVDRDAQGLAVNDDSFLLTEEDTVSSLRTAYEAAVEESRAIFDGLPMDHAATGWVNGGPVTVRWIMAHLIAEYARHLGQADILREQILAADG